MKFTVLIKETLERRIEVDTNNEVSAVIEVEDLHRNQDVVLSADDFCDVTFEVI